MLCQGSIEPGPQCPPPGAVVARDEVGWVGKNVGSPLEEKKLFKNHCYSVSVMHIVSNSQLKDLPQKT